MESPHFEQDMRLAELRNYVEDLPPEEMLPFIRSMFYAILIDEPAEDIENLWDHICVLEASADSATLCNATIAILEWGKDDVRRYLREVREKVRRVGRETLIRQVRHREPMPGVAHEYN